MFYEDQLPWELCPAAAGDHAIERLDLLQRLIQLGDDVLRILQTNGESQLPHGDACGLHILRAVGSMGSLGRIGDRGGKAGQAGHKLNRGALTD